MMERIASSETPAWRASRSLHLLRRLMAAAVFVVLAFGSSGCAGFIYALTSSSAASSLEEAKTLGAEELAEYEYYYAKENLHKAQEEAAAAEYGDALSLANTAEEYAEKAVELARDSHRGAGR